MATFGFIGTGNMGGALARAARRQLPGGEILLANRTAAKAEALAAELSCAVSDNRTAAARSKYLFLGVKPQMMGEMLSDIAPVLSARQDRFFLVSMAAGLSLARIREMAGGDYPVIRIMPNTPAAVGAGMVFYTADARVPAEDLDFFLRSLSGAGRFEALPEHLMDAGSAVAGCGPAFVDLFIEALADGGVACGLPRASAQVFAAQMVLGSAQLVLASGQHPGQLKDAVCSPGGSTIQGVRALERNGFRSAVMEAVIAAWEKSAELGK